VKAVPRSRATRFAGLQGETVRIQVAAPPHRGQANAALFAFLADAAGVPRSAVRMRRGSAGPRKLIEIDGDPGAVAARLIAAAPRA
jgi:uncharacterized protein YggU (UPF0235/DUF167 family)